MRFSPLSFLIGLAAASLVPVLSRVMRPLAVEATAAGMGMLEDARRIVAERVESLEDIAAEARARREYLHAEEMAAAAEEMTADEHGRDQEHEQEPEQPATAGRPRRRTNGAVRRRVS
jgi:hypothetical protein